MTEQQPYDVVVSYPTFEVRRYPAHVVAEMTVTGSFERAANNAFRPLAGYIGGRNAGGTKVAMTAPVLQESASMVQRPTATPGEYVVGFVMPAGSSLEALPAPDDARVTVREVGPQLAAAVRFSGRWTRRAFEDHAARLLRDLAAAGLEVAGPTRFARFDPPWTPWFARHNEVVVPVVDRASQQTG